MDVHVRGVEVLFLAFGIAHVGARISHGGPGRFLHHLAELAGHDQVALAPDEGGFHVEDLAAHLGPGEAGRKPDLALLLVHLGDILRRAEVLGQRLPAHVGRFAPPFGDPARDFPAEVADLALQVPHPGLGGILSDNLAQGPVAEGNLLGFEPVFPHLSRDQVRGRAISSFSSSV